MVGRIIFTLININVLILGLSTLGSLVVRTQSCLTLFILSLVDCPSICISYIILQCVTITLSFLI
jgi:hypothetical protein